MLVCFFKLLERTLITLSFPQNRVRISLKRGWWTGFETLGSLLLLQLKGQTRWAALTCWEVRNSLVKWFIIFKNRNIKQQNFLFVVNHCSHIIRDNETKKSKMKKTHRISKNITSYINDYISATPSHSIFLSHQQEEDWHGGKSIVPGSLGQTGLKFQFLWDWGSHLTSLASVSSSLIPAFSTSVINIDMS